MDKQTPTIGRIVQYMLDVDGKGLQIRPAIVVRVGPAKVSEKNIGQIGLRVFTDQHESVEPLFREAREAAADEFKAGTWRWPPRT